MAVSASRCCRATDILRFDGGLVVEVEVQVGSPLYRRLRLQYKTPRRLVGAPRHLHVASSSIFTASIYLGTGSPEPSHLNRKHLARSAKLSQRLSLVHTSTPPNQISNHVRPISRNHQRPQDFFQRRRPVH